jgi:hypothetical protein
MQLVLFGLVFSFIAAAHCSSHVGLAGFDGLAVLGVVERGLLKEIWQRQLLLSTNVPPGQRSAESR